MMSFRLLSSLRSLPPYLKQSSLQVHTSVALPNSKDSSSSSSSSSDSSDSDSDKEDQRSKTLAKKAPTESLKDAEEALKTSDINERLNTLLSKINVAAQNKKLISLEEKPELNLEGLSSFVSNGIKAAKTTPKSSAATKKAAKPKQNIKTATEESKKACEDGKPITIEKTVNVAIKPKSIRFAQMSKEEQLKLKPHEHQIKQAAKDVAESLGGDAQKTELELLTKALNLKSESSDTASSSEEEKTPTDLSGLLSKMKVQVMDPNKRVQMKTRDFKQASNKNMQSPVAVSVLYKKSVTKPKNYAESGKSELNAPVQPMGIFKQLSTESKDELQLPTWNTMEKRELRLAQLTVPQNVFEELIQWTNERKIWHFPIDNEQGMEDETNVHFSEHVFMERHLKGWCPKRGPIRHFMELVCTGLSKNPYMTVEEKVGHITWYKNYFEDKKELLHELGVLDDKAPTDKKQIEA